MHTSVDLIDLCPLVIWRLGIIPAHGLCTCLCFFLHSSALLSLLFSLPSWAGEASSMLISTNSSTSSSAASSFTCRDDFLALMRRPPTLRLDIRRSRAALPLEAGIPLPSWSRRTQSWAFITLGHA